MLLSISSVAFSQKTAISTNIADYAQLGTLNLSVSYSASRHWSVEASTRYNPFSYNEGDPQEQMQLRQRLYAAGVRYWPWHTFSGWWLSTIAQYQEYSMGGILSQETSEGDRVGAGLSLGYSYLLLNHLNLEFGFGMWAGYDKYAKYDCPVCGVTMKEGNEFFLLPNDIILALTYVF